MDKSAARKEYKQAKQPMGVYRIRNTQNGKSYVGFSKNLPARLNRHKFDLKFGRHQNAELLGEWISFGESFFEFEILDELQPDENPEENPAEDLCVLAEMWIYKLKKEGGFAVML